MSDIEVSDASKASHSAHIDGIAFLLPQLGYHAAGLFAEQIATIGLTPPHVGIPSAIASEPGDAPLVLAAAR
jgi:hypothetical protein